MLQKSQHGKMFCVWGDLCLLCASCVNEIIDVSHAFRFFGFFFVLYCIFFPHYSVLAERFKLGSVQAT